MPILDRFTVKETIEIDEEYGQEIALFEKHEFSVMMQILAIYGDADKCYAGLHLMTMYSQQYKGRTPMEIAHDLYMNWLDDREEKVVTMLCRQYDNNIKKLSFITEDHDVRFGNF